MLLTFHAITFTCFLCLYDRSSEIHIIFPEGTNPKKIWEVEKIVVHPEFKMIYNVPQNDLALIQVL